MKDFRGTGSEGIHTHTHTHMCINIVKRTRYIMRISSDRSLFDLYCLILWWTDCSLGAGQGGGGGQWFIYRGNVQTWWACHTVGWEGVKNRVGRGINYTRGR